VASPQHVYKSSASQWSASKVIHGYDLRSSIDWSHPATADELELCFPWAVSVEQSATIVRETSMSLTEHFQAEAESVKTHIFGHERTSPGAAVALL